MNMKDFLLSWGMLILGVLLNVFGAYAVKAKINTLGSIPFDSVLSVINYFFALIKFPLAIAGAIAILAAPFPYAIALSRMDLSIAYPVSVAINCLILIPITILFLGEMLTVNKSIGILLILVSLFLLHK